MRKSNDVSDIENPSDDKKIIKKAARKKNPVVDGKKASDNVRENDFIGDGYDLFGSSKNPSDHEIEINENNLKLPANFTIKNVSDYQTVLSDAVIDNMEIDASCVERIDGSAMQLLCSLKKTMDSLSYKLSFVNPSEEFLSAIDYLGVNKLFGYSGRVK